jgi:hypothetical protein
MRQGAILSLNGQTSTSAPPLSANFRDQSLCFPIFPDYFCASFKESKSMAVTRLKRKGRKDKAKSAVRRQSLKIQNFQPVIKNVDIEKIKEEFKAKAKKD